MKWLLLTAAGVVAALAAFYRYEDPFLRRWPSPRERKAAERLMAMADHYETQPWA